MLTEMQRMQITILDGVKRAPIPRSLGINRAADAGDRNSISWYAPSCLYGSRQSTGESLILMCKYDSKMCWYLAFLY